MRVRKHDHPIHRATFRASPSLRYGHPYWRGLGRGRAIGFRKTASGGTWVARWTDKDSKYHQKGLGSVDDVSYESAVQQAEEWFQQCEGGVIRSGTVEDVCRQYVENQRNEKGDSAAAFSEGRFKQFVYANSFGRTALDQLTTRDLEKWRDGLVKPGRKKNSVNRVLRSLKAALNFGFGRSMCPSDAAWRRVKPLKGAGAKDQQRTAYLTPHQRGLLLAMCEADHSASEDYDLKEWATKDLANFLRGLLFTSARPNELAAATVGDFDEKQKTLRLVSLKGQGEEKERVAPLGQKAVEFFQRMAKDKPSSAKLMTTSGEPWLRHQWSRGIRAAVAAVNEKAKKAEDRLPADTVAYSMRHCAITDKLQKYSVSDVAKIAGTSITMISNHYAKYIPDPSADKEDEIVAF